MKFGEALDLLVSSRRVAREGWNGKDMFVYYVPENCYPAVTEVAKKEFGYSVKYNPYFAIKNVDGTVSTWVPSVNDCLATDWYDVDGCISSKSTYYKASEVVTAERYRLGLEDGFDTIGVAITEGIDSSHITPECAKFKGVPYLKTITGKSYISDGDYIVTDSDGYRYTCSEADFSAEYRRMEE